VSADDAEAAAAAADQRRRHWRRNLRLTGALMGVWFVVSFALTYFARELSFRFFGWPFSYWMGAQGAILVYLAIVALYAHVMDRLDHAHGVAEED
jgi:putative solute:sodium symporter small subunit